MASRRRPCITHTPRVAWVWAKSSPACQIPIFELKRKWNCNYIYGRLSRSLSWRKTCTKVGLLLGSLGTGDCIKMSPLSRSRLCLSAVAWPQDPVAGEEISLLLHRCANLMTFGNLPNSNLLVAPCPVSRAFVPPCQPLQLPLKPTLELGGHLQARCGHKSS